MFIHHTPKKDRLISGFSQQRRGASLTGYGLIVGLIAIAAITAVSGIGTEVNNLFGGVAQVMQETTGEIVSASEEEGEEDLDTTPSGEPPCSPSPQSGDEGCDPGDGTFYAGESNGESLFVMPVDQGVFLWDGDHLSGGQNFVGATSMTDGATNTLLLAGESGVDNGNGPHPAAEVCAALSGSAGLGHDDWYLPARDELDLLYDNLAANDTDLDSDLIGDTYGFDRGANNAETSINRTYWSSSEVASVGAVSCSVPGGFAYYQRFDLTGPNAGFINNTCQKFNMHNVRCVRRGS